MINEKNLLYYYMGIYLYTCISWGIVQRARQTYEQIQRRMKPYFPIHLIIFDP